MSTPTENTTAAAAAAAAAPKPEIKTVPLKLADQTFQLVVARKRTAGKEPFFIVQLNGSTEKNAAPPTFAQLTRFLTAIGLADAITPVIQREVLNDLTKAVSGVEGIFDADGNPNTGLIPDAIKKAVATALAERASNKEAEELHKAKAAEAMEALNAVVELMTVRGLPQAHADVVKALNRASQLRLELAQMEATRVKNARAKAKAAATVAAPVAK